MKLLGCSLTHTYNPRVVRDGDRDLLAASLAKNGGHPTSRETLPRRQKMKRGGSKLLTPSFGVPIHTHIHEHTPFAPHSYVYTRRIREAASKNHRESAALSTLQMGS